ncbi:hypothetical protein ACL00X_07080 [Aeromonas diversa]|uniref:hypothetical protein n=1 Tax=Aeromonas diversa TaxID=502790 RepID=UPI0039A0FACB
MSLDPVILNETSKIAKAVAALAGSSSPWPVGAIVDLPETRPIVDVYGQTFLRSGVLKDVGAGGVYPEELATVCPKGGFVAAFTSSEFTAFSVACSDDMVVYTRSATALTDQLYVARRDTGFAFSVATLPGAIATQYQVVYLAGIWFFLPWSGSTVIYSLDDLTTFKTVTGVGNPRRVRLFETAAGYRTICFMSLASSSNTDVSVHSFAADGSLNSASSVSVGTTYVVDIIYVPDIPMYFFLRASSTMQKSATLTGAKSNVTPAPTTLGGTTVTTPGLVDSGTKMHFSQLFDGKFVFPLPGAGLVQMDPATSEVSLLIADATFSSFARTLMTDDGKFLLASRTQSTVGAASNMTRVVSTKDSNLQVGISVETSAQYDASNKLIAVVSGGGGKIATEYAVFAGAKKFTDYRYVRIA